jgi:CO/xanthine dehydrogenase FAD-binding subunit
LAATPLFIGGLEFARDQVIDQAVIEKVQQTVDEQVSPISDLRGSEWYKRRMAGLYVKKAIEQLNQG